DLIADLTEGSKFFQHFSQNTRLGPLEELTPSITIHNQWPSFKEVSERIFKPDFTFDDVSNAVKDESMKDAIAGYAYNIMSAYRKAISGFLQDSTCNEGVLDFTNEITHTRRNAPKDLAVFGSTSFNTETRFYKMDIAGVFRVYEFNRMVIPTTRSGFGERMKACMLCCLEFALLLKSEPEK
ncbi:hypothetical protein BGX27_010368, partial [Mortierella sp. AM989]